MSSDAAGRGEWSDAEKFAIIQQFIPDKLNWGDIKLPPGRSLKAAKCMMGVFKKKMTAAGPVAVSSQPTTPSSGKKRGRPAGKTTPDSGAANDTPSKRKRSVHTKPQSFICEDDDSDEEDLDLPIIKKMKYGEKAGALAAKDLKGKVKKEAKEEKGEFDSEFENGMLCFD